MRSSFCSSFRIYAFVITLVKFYKGIFSTLRTCLFKQRQSLCVSSEARAACLCSSVCQSYFLCWPCFDYWGGGQEQHQAWSLGLLTQVWYSVQYRRGKQVTSFLKFVMKMFQSFLGRRMFTIVSQFLYLFWGMLNYLFKNLL